MSRYGEGDEAYAADERRHRGRGRGDERSRRSSSSSSSRRRRSGSYDDDERRGRRRHRRRGSRERDDRPSSSSHKRGRSRSRSPSSGGGSSALERIRARRRARRPSDMDGRSAPPAEGGILGAPRSRSSSSAWDQPPVAPPAPTGPPMPMMPMMMMHPGVVPMPDPANDRQHRRLYVGSIPSRITEAELLEFLNTALLSAGRPTSECIVEASIHSDGKFGFLELPTPQAATNALALDGIELHGRSIKIRRPADYVPPPGGEPEPTQPHIPGIVATEVPDGPHKMFLGGLPLRLTEPQVKELIGSFGALRAFNLVTEQGGARSKGYCFFEYVEPSVSEAAIAGLEGLKIDGKELTIQRAQQPGGGPMGGAPSDEPLTTAAKMLDLTKPVAAELMALPVADLNDKATNTLVLLNAISPIDLIDDTNFEEIKADITREASNYGTVVEVRIPRPPAPEEEPDPLTDLGEPLVPDWIPGIGRVFVEFSQPSETEAAQAALSGRRYQGRTIVTMFHNPEAQQAFVDKITALDAEAVRAKESKAEAEAAKAREAQDMRAQALKIAAKLQDAYSGRH